MSFKITWKTHVICTIIAYLTVKIMGQTADIIIENFFLKPFIFYPTESLIINFFIYVLLLMIPISIVHESIHGLSYRVFGGTVKYGFKGIYAYTQEISELPINRTKFLIILLAPLTIISILTVLLPIWLGGIIFLLNLLGATGDLYMSYRLIRYNSNSKIVDRIYGFDVVQ
ncbi:DUF3267 domain-containing protein [Clostridium lacusfryxellense]|uniref:DUF3267 domain-containing protein n=1 Tax=Clostridium lacusfryxellense TaxID=205328 RepID=UPI001C0ABBC7|nr:DUF3267 domain-containing protein [Clostridium lacusfryxellense]MBU3110254.1 DUF3267 domain-containing protein [Clostridium lacusfryxellense]